jgi:hypothetical protein
LEQERVCRGTDFASEDGGYDDEVCIEDHCEKARLQALKRTTRSNQGTVIPARSLVSDGVQITEHTDAPGLANPFAAHGAPSAFGRSLKPLIGRTRGKPGTQAKGCAFLVLDHAEHFLTTAPKRLMSRVRNNFLSQILLLPKQLALNLTIVFISKSSLLGGSRKYIHDCHFLIKIV